MFAFVSTLVIVEATVMLWAKQCNSIIYQMSERAETWWFSTQSWYS